MLLMHWYCWCADAPDLLMLLMLWCCSCSDAVDTLMLLMLWCCWCTDLLMLLMHWGCWCANANTDAPVLMHDARWWWWVYECVGVVVVVGALHWDHDQDQLAHSALVWDFLPPLYLYFYLFSNYMFYENFTFIWLVQNSNPANWAVMFKYSMFALLPQPESQRNWFQIISRFRNGIVLSTQNHYGGGRGGCEFQYFWIFARWKVPSVFNRM